MLGVVKVDSPEISILLEGLYKVFHSVSLGIGTKAPLIRLFTTTRDSEIIGAERVLASFPFSS